MDLQFGSRRDDMLNNDQVIMKQVPLNGDPNHPVSSLHLMSEILQLARHNNEFGTKINFKEIAEELSLYLEKIPDQRTVSQYFRHSSIGVGNLNTWIAMLHYFGGLDPVHNGLKEAKIMMERVSTNAGINEVKRKFNKLLSKQTMKSQSAADEIVQDPEFI